ncbi:ABC transporter substrate-binding protein [Paenibacillus sp. TY11]|uniref:ABC transporter substrate-binding protein n=1 Tax=Paenibacillus sp. TY11 TaxID=3448633 RepID=UPI0040392E7B
MATLKQPLRTGMLLAAILVLLTVIMAGCGSQSKDNSAATSQATGDTRIIKHEMGETQITGKPKRIVTLEFSFVDATTQLGVTPVGIAQENDDDIDGLLGKKIDFTPVGTRKQPNLETISSLKPDLIIADLNRHKNIYKELSEIAPTIVLKSRNSSYEQNLTSFGVIADALDEKEKGEQILAAHKAKMEKLEQGVKAGEPRSVLVGVFRSDSLTGHAASSFDGQLLELAGIHNALQNTSEPTVKLTLEQIAQADPDVIFMAEADEKLISEWKPNPLWQNITAVKKGEVYEVNRALWTRYRGLGSAEKILEQAISLLYPAQSKGDGSR